MKILFNVMIVQLIVTTVSPSHMFKSAVEVGFKKPQKPNVGF